jgi:hypothetical protein
MRKRQDEERVIQVQDQGGVSVAVFRFEKEKILRFLWTVFSTYQCDVLIRLILHCILLYCIAFILELFPSFSNSFSAFFHNLLILIVGFFSELSDSSKMH